MKYLHTARDTKKTLKRGGCKTKVWQRNNDNNILWFYFFVYEKGYIVLENMVIENLVYISYYFYSKVLFSVTGYSKRGNKTPMSIDLHWSRRRITLPQNPWQWSRHLTSVLTAMKYFFRWQKNTFNLKNNKCICQENFFCWPRNWIYLLQNYFYLYKTWKGIGKI